jgi:hypothetical protein
MSIVNTKKTYGGTEFDIVKTVSTITPTSSVDVDVVVVTAHRSIKWVVSLTNPTTLEYRSYEILALVKGTTAVTHTIYAKIGDNIQHNVDVVVSGGNVNLSVQNNEANDIDVSVSRFGTSV